MRFSLVVLMSDFDELFRCWFVKPLTESDCPQRRRSVSAVSCELTFGQAFLESISQLFTQVLELQLFQPQVM